MATSKVAHANAKDIGRSSTLIAGVVEIEENIVEENMQDVLLIGFDKSLLC